MANKKQLDLINRGELLDADYLVSMDGALGYVVDSEIVRRAKRVDAVEVVHGRWEKVKQDLGDGIKTYRFGCSECGYLKNTLTGNYCPNCGAKMDEEMEE